MPIDKFSQGCGAPLKPADIRPKKGAILAPGQPTNQDGSGSEKNGPQDLDK